MSPIKNIHEVTEPLKAVLRMDFGFSVMLRIMLDKQSKIYVAGHNGLVGAAIWNNLLKRKYEPCK